MRHLPLFFIFALLVALPSTASARTMVVGVSGSDVVALQNALIAAGYLEAGRNTGYFGALTEAAVKKFQCEKSIICEGDSAPGYGVAGPKTQAALLGGGSSVATDPAAPSRTLVVGMSGADVTTIQKHLIAQGYLASGYATGYYGGLTEAAVKKFQCAKEIVCDGGAGYGTVGNQTRIAIVAGTVAVTNPGTLREQPLTPAATGKFEISGWIPYWRTEAGTADTKAHLDQLTSVMPFAYSVKQDGTLADTAKLTEEPWVSFMAEAKRQNVRVIPSIMWGDGEHIHRILSDTTKRIALEDEIAKLVRDNGFDGIDIDFEAKKHETVTYFSLFLKGLYQRMGNKWVYCTIESRMPLEDRYLPGQTIPADAKDRANDFVEMNKYCDRIEIMAYDQGTVAQRLNAARTAPYAPVGDPAWVENVTMLAAQSIDRNKLILGIPTYGYEYKVTPLGGNSYKYERLWAFNPKYALDIALRLGILPQRNSGGDLGFSYDPNVLATRPTADQIVQLQQQGLPASSVTTNAGAGTSSSQPFNFVSWHDQKAIADKVALARTLGLRGVAVFKFDGGQDPGMWSILK